MSAWIDREEGKAALLGWSVRGMLVSIPSWLWALARDYRHPAELLAMLVGTVLWVLVFATGSSLKMVTATEPGRRWLGALRGAAWLKVAWVLASVGVVYVAGGLKLKSGWMIPLGSGAGIDLLTGALITEHLGRLGRWAGSWATSSANSFSWTLVITLLQGGAVAVELILVAFALRGLAWLKAGPGIFRRQRWVPD